MCKERDSRTLETDESSEPVRVCHISTVHHPSDVRIFHRECRSLVESGYEVHLVIRCERSTIRDGVHIHALSGVRFRPVRTTIMPWVALFAALRTKTTIYHLHDPELLPIGFVLRRLLGKRVVYDIHEAVTKQIMSKAWLPQWSRRAASALYWLAERLLSGGQELLLANENCVPDYPPSAHLVRNFPVVRKLPFVPAAQRRQPPLLVYVGGVTRIRGAMVYVELADRLRRRGHEFRMMIVGPCPRAYTLHLASEIESRGLAEIVTLEGRMEYEQAMNLVSQATIGMCLLLPVPNYTTCLATKIIEYMMLGTPVLSSDFGCWRDYVVAENTGVVVDPTDIDSVVAGCEALLSDANELCAMGERGIAAVRSRYNWESEFAVLEHCYQRLLGDRTCA